MSRKGMWWGKGLVLVLALLLCPADLAIAAEKIVIVGTDHARIVEESMRLW